MGCETIIDETQVQFMGIGGYKMYWKDDNTIDFKLFQWYMEAKEETEIKAAISLGRSW